MNWKIGFGIAAAAALVAIGYAIHKHNQVAGPASTGERKEASETVGLATLQFKKGAKAVAEASKNAQLGEVRAEDRTAAKAVAKGG